MDIFVDNSVDCDWLARCPLSDSVDTGSSAVLRSVAVFHVEHGGVLRSRRLRSLGAFPQIYAQGVVFPCIYKDLALPGVYKEAHAR